MTILSASSTPQNEKSPLGMGSVTGLSAVLHALVLATRPKTLTAGAIPVLVGTAVAAFELSGTGEVQWHRSLWALLSALAIQIGTNLFNDALDWEKGADTHERLGPTRVTSAGLLPVWQVYAGACVAFLVATLFGLLLVFEVGLVVLIIGVLSLLFGYLYTGGPYPLAYRGLGDLFVLLFFGIVAVMGTVYLHTNSWSWPGFLAGMQVGLLAVALIAINNFRDVEEDRRANKNTLAVRFGLRAARAEVVLCVAAPGVLGLLWWIYESPYAFFFPLFALPLVGQLVRAAQVMEPSRECNVLLGQAAKLHAVMGVLLALGLWFSR